MIDPKKFDSKFFDDIASKIAQFIPNSVKDLQKDIESNVKAVLQNGFSKLDLVSRDEFDVQTKVLARSREKLEALEQRIAELELALKNKTKTKKD